MAAKISIILQTSKHSAVFLMSIYSYTVIQFYFGGIVSTIYGIINIYIYIYINNKVFSKKWRV